MKKTAEKSFYPAAGYVLAVAWLMCLLAVFLKEQFLLSGMISTIVCIVLTLVLTVVLTVLNICFRKKRAWLLWVINAVMMLVSALYCLLLAGLFTLVYGSPEQWKEAAELGLSGLEMSRISEYDDHDSFLGDGTSMKVYGFSYAEEAADRMEQAEGWHPLPLDDSVNRLVYGDEEHNSYLTDSQNRVLAPEVEKGFWYFEDRQAKNEKEKYSTNVFGRYSYNFTAALYDEQTGRLYVLKLDT